MRGFALVIGVLALTGCSRFFEPSRSPVGTPQRACEDAADADPRLRDFVATQPRKASPNDFTADDPAFRSGLIADCLRNRSGRPGGGVEKVIK